MELTPLHQNSCLHRTGWANATCRQGLWHMNHIYRHFFPFLHRPRQGAAVHPGQMNIPAAAARASPPVLSKACKRVKPGERGVFGCHLDRGDTLPCEKEEWVRNKSTNLCLVQRWQVRGHSLASSANTNANTITTTTNDKIRC